MARDSEDKGGGEQDEEMMAVMGLWHIILVVAKLFVGWWGRRQGWSQDLGRRWVEIKVLNIIFFVRVNSKSTLSN